MVRRFCVLQACTSVDFEHWKQKPCKYGLEKSIHSIVNSGLVDSR
jgi:hypothetical protein